jgi:hypothetical protein
MMRQARWPGRTQRRGLAAVGRPEGVMAYRHQGLGSLAPGLIPAAAEGRLDRTGSRSDRPSS